MTAHKVWVCLGVFSCRDLREELLSLDQESYAVIFEPQMANIESLAEYCDFTDVISRDNVYIYYSKTYDEMLDILDGIGWASSICTKYYIHKDQTLEDIRDFLNAYRDFLIAKEVEGNTLLFFSSIWQRNYLVNIRHMNESSNHLDFWGKFEGIPGIMVCAGPSLDNSLEALREAKGKALIMAAYTALKPLLAAGIEPDLVMSIDGHQLRYETDEEMANPIYTPLIYSLNADTRLFEKFHGPKIHIYGGMDMALPFFDYNAKDMIRFGGSVACSMADFLYRMGVEPLILVGQDLSYKKDRTHAANTFHEKHKPPAEKRFEIPGRDGPVETTKVLYTFLVWLEKYFAETPIKVINATDGGANIKGTERADLNDIVKGLQPIDIKGMLDSILKCPEPTDWDLLERLKKADKELARLGQGAKRAIDSVEKLEYNEADREAHHELDVFDALLKEKSDGKSIIELLIYVKHSELGLLKSDDFKTHGAYVLNKCRNLYQGIVEAVDFSIPLLRNSIEVMESKQENLV